MADSMISSIPGQEELSFRSGTHQLTVLRHGLRGWTNFMDGDGKPVAFEKTRAHPGFVTDDCLDRMLPRHRQELVGVILERGSITETEGE